MGYTALYRKFRPSSFADVKGQDHIVTTLQNQIKADRIGHAYLFCGTRGTGKTTIAKILAKAVNCEHPVDGNPCGECDTCRAIAAGTSMNVIEIDAASNNGVDNIREIRDEVAYSPAEGRYKVYIIDEVHMLSIGAFNALLKTLEEPPSYVIFILATTEAHKIPITILSRCQRYDFKRIDIETIASRLRDLMDQEQVDVEEKALRYIAKKADGSMRDALSLLDQCIAFYLGQKLTYDHVLEVLGAVDTDVFSKLLREILKNDIVSVISTLEELIMQGREIGQMVSDFTWYIRNLMLVKSSENMEDVLDVSTENLRQLEEEAAMVREDTLMRYIRVLSELSNQIRYSSSRRVLVEMAFMKLCRPQMERDEISLTERVRILEKKLEEYAAAFQSGMVPQGMLQSFGGTRGQAAYGESWGGQSGAEAGNQALVGQSGAAASGMSAAGQPLGAAGMGISPADLPKAAPKDLQQVKALWKSIIAQTHGRFRVVLSSAEPKYNTSGGDERLFVAFADFLAEPYINNEEAKAELEQLIAAKIGKHVEVQMVLQADEHLSKGHLADIDVEGVLKEAIHTEIMIED